MRRERAVRSGQVERLGVESVAEPLEPLGVVLAGRLSQRVEQLSVAEGPAAVVRRRGPPAVEAVRGVDGRVGRQDVLDDDVVLPVVAEVVAVEQLRSLARRDAAQRHPAFVLDALLLAPPDIELRRSEPAAAGLELVEVAVGPGEDSLEHRVQGREGGGARHLDAPPDRRADVAEGDLQLVDRGWLGSLRNLLSARRLRRCGARASGAPGRAWGRHAGEA